MANHPNGSREAPRTTTKCYLYLARIRLARHHPRGAELERAVERSAVHSNRGKSPRSVSRRLLGRRLCGEISPLTHPLDSPRSLPSLRSATTPRGMPGRMPGWTWSVDWPIRVSIPLHDAGGPSLTHGGPSPRRCRTGRSWTRWTESASSPTRWCCRWCSLLMILNHFVCRSASSWNLSLLPMAPSLMAPSPKRMLPRPRSRALDAPILSTLLLSCHRSQANQACWGQLVGWRELVAGWQEPALAGGSGVLVRAVSLEGAGWLAGAGVWSVGGSGTLAKWGASESLSAG